MSDIMTTPAKLSDEQLRRFLASCRAVAPSSADHIAAHIAYQDAENARLTAELAAKSAELAGLRAALTDKPKRGISLVQWLEAASKSSVFDDGKREWAGEILARIKSSIPAPTPDHSGDAAEKVEPVAAHPERPAFVCPECVNMQHKELSDGIVQCLICKWRGTWSDVAAARGKAGEVAKDSSSTPTKLWFVNFERSCIPVLYPTEAEALAQLKETTASMSIEAIGLYCPAYDDLQRRLDEAEAGAAAMRLAIIDKHGTPTALIGGLRIYAASTKNAERAWHTTMADKLEAALRINAGAALAERLRRLEEFHKCVLAWAEAGMDAETSDAERNGVMLDILREAQSLALTNKGW